MNNKNKHKHEVARMTTPSGDFFKWGKASTRPLFLLPYLKSIAFWAYSFLISQKTFLFFVAFLFSGMLPRGLANTNEASLYVAEICDNGIDDDGDGLIDGYDSDCPESGVQPSSMLCNKQYPWTSSTFTNVTASVTNNVFSIFPPCLGAVSNVGNLVDGNDSNYAEVSITGLGCNAIISVKDNDAGDTYPAGTYAGFKVSSAGLLNGSILSSVTIKTYNNNSQAESYSAVSSLLGVNSSLLNADGTVTLGFVTTADFDEIRIEYRTLVGVLFSAQVYNAVVQRFCEGSPLPCNTQVPMTNPDYPVVISGPNTGVTGLACVACAVVNTENIISTSPTDYATIQLTTSIGTSASVAVKDGLTNYPAGYFAGFDVYNASLISLDLLDMMTVTTYLDGVAQESKTGKTALLSLNSFLFTGGNRNTVGFIAEMPFDEVKVTINNLLGVDIGVTRIYQMVVQRFCAGPPLECNTPTFVSNPTHPVVVNWVNTGVAGIACIGCEVDNTDNLLTPSTTDYAKIQLTTSVGVAGSVSVKHGLGGYPAGTFAGFDVMNISLLNLQLLDATTITTYLDGVQQEKKVGQFELISFGSFFLTGTTRNMMGFIATKPFDEVKLTITNLVGIDLGETRIYGLAVESFCEATLACSEVYHLHNPDFPVVVNSGRSGLLGVACVGCEVDNTQAVLTADNTDYANITVGVGVLTQGAVSVQDALTTFPTGSKAGFVIEDANNLLQLDLFQAITICTYLDGVQQECKTGINLIDFALFINWIGMGPGKYNVGFTTTKPYDEIQIKVGSLASILNTIHVYGAFVDTRDGIWSSVGLNLGCPEICNNGIDDDGDGLIDCADPDCYNSLDVNITAGALNVCDGQSTVLSAQASGGTAPYTYTWNQNLGTNPSNAILPTANTNYSVTVTDDHGCSNVGDIDIAVDDCTEICSDGIDNDGDGLVDCDDPSCAPALVLTAPQSVCLGNAVTINANASGNNGPYIIAWDNGLGTGSSKSVSPASSSTYSVTATGISGCSATTQITIDVVNCTEICTDGIDNDNDGLVDCDDPDCQLMNMPQAVPDDFISCPGVVYSNAVSANDENLHDAAYSVVTPPAKGFLTINNFGIFTYTPADPNCGTVQFTYQVCNQGAGCCATADVTLTLGDSQAPTLVNAPADITISCDDEIPMPPTVFGQDACPGISTSFDESTTLGSMGGCATYSMTRTWAFEDLCGNSTAHTQTINIEDKVRPEIFRVYTLPNGKRLVAGVAQNTSHLWKYIKFPVHFDSTPLVFAQVTSLNDRAPVVAQTRYISDHGFELRLKEEEAADNVHSGELVSWVAFEQGNLSGISGFTTGLLTGVGGILQDLTGLLSLSSTNSFFIGAQQDIAEADPATVRYSPPGLLSGMQVMLQEEQSADSEIAHVGEDLAYLVMNTGAELFDVLGDFIAESGKINANHGWHAVDLTHEFTKPVVIMGGLGVSDPDPATIRVRNVTSNSFEVKVQEWDYLDGPHSFEELSFLVLEGGLPISGWNSCFEGQGPQIGVDIFAVDNCNEQIVFDFSENQVSSGNGLSTQYSYVATDECGNVNLQTKYDTCDIAAFRLKVNLAGALINGTDNLMRDELRVKNLIPLKNPYLALPGFENILNPLLNDGTAIVEHITSNLLSQEGDGAIVDWLFVECRSASNPAQILSEITVPLRRNGNACTTSGTDVLYFTGLPDGDYYIVVKHRNHLGMITNTPFYLNSEDPPLIDFNDFNTSAENGQVVGAMFNGEQALWAGDFNGDGKVVYQGPENDIFSLFSRVLSDPDNTQFLANYIVHGYMREDFNLDGLSIYQGPNNDRAMVLFQTVLKNSNNQNFLANYIVSDLLP